MISKSFLVLGVMLTLILATSLYAQVGIQEADAMKKGSHHTASSKAKISKSLKAYHATGLTKKQRGG